MPLVIFTLYYIHYKTSRITSSCPVKITGYGTLKKGRPPTLLFSLKPLPKKRRNLNELSSALEMLLQFLYYY